MDKLSRDEIEHQVFQEQLKGIVIQMNANFEVVNMSLETMKVTTTETLKQTKKTNGRVDDLEENVVIIRTLKKHKWFFGLVILGLMKIYEVIDIKKLIDILINYIL